MTAGEVCQRLTASPTLRVDDGSVWVHLDHAESHRCHAVLDEEFGSDHFAAEVAGRGRGTQKRHDRHIDLTGHDSCLSKDRPLASRSDVSFGLVQMRRVTSPVTVIRSHGGTATLRRARRLPTIRCVCRAAPGHERADVSNSGPLLGKGLSRECSSR